MREVFDTAGALMLGAAPRRLPLEVERAYRLVSDDARYGHYARIPARICRCLEHFGVDFERADVERRLHAYYLFIGVADDWIDSCGTEAGEEILSWLLCETLPSFDDEAVRSRARLLTEVLKCYTAGEDYSTVPPKLEVLYRAVARERAAASISEYIDERRTVGRLTAEVSYRLIRPLLRGGRGGLRRFLRDVGEVGCLVDSLIDLKSDEELGLLRFRPTLGDRLQLAAHTLRGGLALALRHPRMFGLFAAAVGDVVLDRHRARG